MGDSSLEVHYCTLLFLAAVARRVPKPRIEQGIYVDNVKEKIYNNLENERVLSLAIINFY